MRARAKKAGNILNSRFAVRLSRDSAPSRRAQERGPLNWLISDGR